MDIKVDGRKENWGEIDFYFFNYSKNSFVTDGRGNKQDAVNEMKFLVI